ncbi:hypothetical protein WGT02_38665 (plasmid) [Rhizobium sp. T1470]|uniref:hypothetical protein n=1 Tax=unclassified Rhizobium TaxID=2613769 RepID=UPI001CD80ED4|nr:hypothetical protein [Rhizobium sp. T1473]MCA0807330.1 hypothetical protein [Rhizobium sp. T1473]
MFVGLYAARLLGPLPADRQHPITGGIEPAGSCNVYEVDRLPSLSEYAGRLWIDWGDSYRSWIQRGDGKAKRLIELRRTLGDPPFPGFAAFIANLSDIESLPATWQAPLSATSGIYLLTCPRTREQYFGMASGVDGFIGRWREYFATGHGGNVGLKSRDPSDYQLSILKRSARPRRPRTSGSSNDAGRTSCRAGKWALTGTDMTKADQIRSLAADGLKAADIAARLGIRYQHAYNVINAGPRRTLEAATKPSPIGRPETRPQSKPALTTDILISGGFTRVGRWIISGDSLAVETPAPKSKGVYAFVKAGVALYVGVATKGLAGRLYSYGRPGISQRINQRLEAIIMAELSGPEAIEIFIAMPPDLEWNGLPVNGSAGLELGLIEKYSLPWNIRGATALEAIAGPGQPALGRDPGQKM